MDSVNKKIEEYQNNFDTLVQERQQLNNRVNEINVALEQLRGAVAALKGLEVDLEEEPKEAKPAKEDKK